MPRDLAQLASLQPESLGRRDESSEDAQLPKRQATSQAAERSAKPGSALETLHPYTQQLTLADVESCYILEEATFPPQERCTREKFRYRFETCAELSLGAFTSVGGESDLLTFSAARPVTSDDPARRAVLLAHIVATKGTGSTVTDDDMAYPTPANPDPKLGHKESGRTVCLHSLAVLPSVQKLGLGSTLMTAYIERLESEDIADRLALIAHDHLVSYYERFGFVSLGKSKAQFGGGGWYDMVRPLHSKQPSAS